MRGRPKKVINKQQFEELCKMQCTEKEICAVLDCTDKTLNVWTKDTYDMGFREIYKIKREAGKASLRRKQWDLAGKSSAMAIFLGKNYLEQSDKQEIISENTNVNKNVDLSNLTTEEIKELLKNED